MDHLESLFHPSWQLLGLQLHKPYYQPHNRFHQTHHSQQLLLQKNHLQEQIIIQLDSRIYHDH